MRLYLAMAAVLCLTSGCGRSPLPNEKTVHVTLRPAEKSWAAQGPKSTKEYPHWPYSTMSTGGRGKPGEWKSGLAFDRDRIDPKDVELRFFDVSGGAVKVEVTFAGPASPDLASLTFEHCGKVDRVVEFPKEGGAERPYTAWSLKGEDFELRAPSAGARISFLTWPHVR